MKDYKEHAAHITNLLRAHPRGMTITGISRALHLNRNRAAKYLEILVTSGQVEKQDTGREKRFSLSRQVPIAAMLNLSSDMIVILDGESRILYVNDNFVAFEKKEREDFLGKDVGDLELDLFSDPEIRNRLRHPPENQEYWKEVTVARGSGRFVFVVSLISTIFEDGSRGITVIIEDITERKRAEESLRELLFFFQELLDRVPTPVFYKDMNGFYLGCNLAYEKFTRKSRDEILERKAIDVLPAGLVNRFEAMDESALRTGTVQTFESAIHYDDGTRRDFIVFKAPFLKPDGSPGGVVGTIIDTTDRRDAEGNEIPDPDQPDPETGRGFSGRGSMNRPC